MTTIHPKFKLNGRNYNDKALKTLARTWVEEGVGIQKQTGIFLYDWSSGDDAIIVNTSGSTGEPKAIEVKKKRMVNSALATGRYFQLRPSNTALLCLSPAFIAGKMMLVRAMVLGLELDVVEPTTNPLNGISKSYDFAAMVPMQVRASLTRLNQIKTLIIGGAPISSALRTLLSEQKNDLFETYGMTETITHIAVKKISRVPDEIQEQYFETLPNVSIESDARQCLVIDAPLILEDCLVTNDIVEIVDKGRFKWLGRYDNIINSGGIKLIPEQIEMKIAAYIRPRFFVAGIPDEVLGERLVLFIEGNGDKAVLNKDSNIFQKLAKYERPKEIVYLPEFQETANGKINRMNTLRHLK